MTNGKAAALVLIGWLVFFSIGSMAEADTVVVTNSGEKEQDSTTTIVTGKDGSSTMVHCLSTKTGLIVCQEL